MKKILAIVIAICMMLNLSMVIYASSQSLDRGHKQNGIVTASTNYMSGTNQIRYQASIDSDIVVPIETFLEGEIYVNSIYKGSRTDTNQLSDTAYVNFYISQPSSAIYEIYAYGYTSYNTALGETFVYDDDWGSYNHNIIPNTYSLNEINTYANAIAKNVVEELGYDITGFVIKNIYDDSLPFEFINYYYSLNKTEGQTKPVIYVNMDTNTYLIVFCKADGTKVIEEFKFIVSESQTFTMNNFNFTTSQYSCNGEFVSFDTFMATGEIS